jgi:HAE1 family hydrophobic/amphiphilic exporter-1
MPESASIFGSILSAASGFLSAIGFFSRDNRYDGLFLSNYVDLYVRDAFKRVPGVGNVQIFGERKYAMRLWLDPNRLAARSLTPGDVVGALREQNVQVAAGSVGDSPADDDQLFQLSVRAAGRLREVRDFEDVVVKAGRDGALVRVKDVGRVELGAESYSSVLRFAGVEAAGVGIQLLPTANALDAFAGVQRELDRLRKSFPPGLEAQIAFDNVVVVQESIIEVLNAMSFGSLAFTPVVKMLQERHGSRRQYEQLECSGRSHDRLGTVE